MPTRTISILAAETLALVHGGCYRLAVLLGVALSMWRGGVAS